MNKLALHNINAFRTAQELSSSEPTQLKRTIEELEVRIMEQDGLIAQQNEGLQKLARGLEEREHELEEIRGAGSKKGAALARSSSSASILQSLEKEKLEKAGLHVFTIQQLQQRAEKIVGVPDPIRYKDRIVGVVMYRDNTIIDVVHEIDEYA